MDQLADPADQRPDQTGSGRGSPASAATRSPPRPAPAGTIGDRLARLADCVQLDEADPGRGGLGADQREEALEHRPRLDRLRRRGRAEARSAGSTSSEAAAVRHSALLAKCL